jgi:hypothetical protein
MIDDDDDFDIPTVYQNAIKIFTDNGGVDYIVSSHCHDFVRYEWEDGSSIAVDGGNDYIRRACIQWVSIGRIYCEEFNIRSSDDFDTLKKRLLWGNKNSEGKVVWTPLSVLSSIFLDKILTKQLNLDKKTEIVIKAILLERECFR